MSTLSPSLAHRPHGYAAEAREWLVEQYRERGPDPRNGPPAETCADMFLAEAWSAGFKLVPLEEHDLDIGRAA